MFVFRFLHFHTVIIVFNGGNWKWNPLVELRNFLWEVSKPLQITDFYLFSDLEDLLKHFHGFSKFKTGDSLEMPRNVEIKASVDCLAEVKEKAAKLSPEYPPEGVLIEQNDTFFKVNDGRQEFKCEM